MKSIKPLLFAIIAIKISSCSPKSSQLLQQIPQILTNPIKLPFKRRRFKNAGADLDLKKILFQWND
jgi:hypothetical protein